MFVVGVYDDFYNADFKLKIFTSNYSCQNTNRPRLCYIKLLRTFWNLYEVPCVTRSTQSTIFVFLIVVNAINFIDGIDGLSNKSG